MSKRKKVTLSPKKHILPLGVEFPSKIPVISDYSCQYSCLYTEICATFHWAEMPIPRGRFDHAAASTQKVNEVSRGEIAESCPKGFWKICMKILICGAHGQLGYDSKQVLRSAHEVVSTDIEELDITDPSATNEMVESFRPDIIVNCAAFTKVDDCETMRELAWKVNVDGPKNLAIAAHKTGAQLIHISTDYVFDGNRKVPEPYEEADTPHPLSTYGRTKLEGEEAIRKATDRYMILRTAWLYGINGQNFLKTMLRLAIKDPQREIKVVNDQFGSPTWSYRLALQIARLIEVNGQGTYHATSGGYCTWYELAAQFFGLMEVRLTITPCTTQEYPTPAPRPVNSILENRRLKDSGINVMSHWNDDLVQFVSTFKERLKDEA